MDYLSVVAGTPKLVNGVLLLWLFSAGVGALRMPDSESSALYTWLFRFLHLLAANLDRAGLLEQLPRGIEAGSSKSLAQGSIQTDSGLR